MKRGSNKLFVGSIVFMFLLLASSSFVLAQSSGSAENFFRNLGDRFGEFVDNSLGGDFSPGPDFVENEGQVDLITKILILIIVSILVYSLAGSLGLFQGTVGRILLFFLSFAIGFLSTWSLSNSTVLNLTQIYSSFGGALVTLIPFLVLGGFTIRAVIDGDVQMMVMQHVAWALFFAFLSYTFLIQLFNSDAFFLEFIFFEQPLLLLVMILTLVLTFANSSAIGALSKTVLGAKAVRAANTLEDIERGADVLKTLGRG